MGWIKITFFRLIDQITTVKELVGIEVNNPHELILIHINNALTDLIHENYKLYIY